MRCPIFPLSLLILAAIVLQAEGANKRALRTHNSQAAVGKWLRRVSEHVRRSLPPMSHGWAFEGDDEQDATPCPVPILLTVPTPADKDAAVEEERAVSSMALLHADDPMKEKEDVTGMDSPVLDLSVRDEVGKARPGEDTVREAPPHGDKVADSLP